ncbi:MAG TPA: FadR family transcriptional regulator, partial [Cupriavidus sp.]|nr:FadR family transcriptional regulator [Cupriavidus sp.]
AFDVSRNVVREAIARLKLSGYVETRRGTGSFVAHGIGQRNFEIVTDELMEKDALEHVFQ